MKSFKKKKTNENPLNISMPEMKQEVTYELFVIFLGHQSPQDLTTLYLHVYVAGL